MLARRREGRRAREARSVHLLRGRAARRRHRHVRADGGRRTGGGTRSSSRDSALAVETLARAGRARQSRDRVAARAGSAIVTRVTDTGEPGFDLFVERAQADALQTRADRRRRGRGRRRHGRGDPHRGGRAACFTATWTRRRFRSRRASSRARSASRKGCYVGQEVIIRVLHRGHGRVARKLVGLAARRRRGAAGRRARSAAAIARSAR